MHLENFKGLSGEQINAFVDLGIEVKCDPEKYRKALGAKSLALVLLCLEMKTIRSGLVKLSVRDCAFTLSSFSMIRVTSFLFTWAW